MDAISGPVESEFEDLTKAESFANLATHFSLMYSRDIPSDTTKWNKKRPNKNRPLPTFRVRPCPVRKNVCVPFISSKA